MIRILLLFLMACEQKVEKRDDDFSQYELPNESPSTQENQSTQTVDNNIEHQLKEQEATKAVIENLSTKDESQQDISKEDVLKLKDDDIFLGSKEAKVVMVEYSSFTCPGCKNYHIEIFPKIKSEYIDTGKILYIKRPLATDRQAYEACIMLRCAYKIEKKLNFIDVFFAKQDSWAFNRKYREMLIDIGRIGGVSAASFEACSKNEILKSKIINSTKDAAQVLKISGTPTFFINGVQMTDGYSLENIRTHLDKVLNNL